jgi:opacity protein-like surface antigen
VLGIRAQLMRRSLSLGTPDPAHPALGDHASNGWGLGVTGGLDIDVTRRFRLEVSYARERIRLQEYPHLELWNRSTAAKWTATALRLGVGYGI